MANELFTPDDAQAIVNICRSAPLPHLDAAQERIKLMAKFVNWCNGIFAPTPDSDTPVPTAEALKAAGIRPIIPQE